MLAVVVADVEVSDEYRFERLKVGTSPADLRALADWLVERELEEVVTESTAQYWRPVWEALELHWRPTCRTHEGAGLLPLAQAPACVRQRSTLWVGQLDAGPVMFQRRSISASRDSGMLTLPLPRHRQLNSARSAAGSSQVALTETGHSHVPWKFFVTAYRSIRPIGLQSSRRGVSLLAIPSLQSV
jgi:hypothetical protein